MYGTTFPMYYLELTYEVKHIDDGKLLLSFLIFYGFVSFLYYVDSK